MSKSSFLKLTLALVAVLLVVGVGYAGWRILWDEIQVGQSNTISEDGIADLEVSESPTQTEIQGGTPKVSTSQGNEVEPWYVHNFGSAVYVLLPGAVRELVCDELRCFSKGTILPGGTRFTIAVLGTSRNPADSFEQFKKELIKTGLYQSQVTINTREAIFFTGKFQPQNHLLVPQVSFTDQKVKIKGYIIKVHEDRFVEVTIAASDKTVVDFDADEQLFSEIIRRLQFQ